MQISKYSASGNDFVIFHSFLSRDRKELAKRICNRFSGVGADGLIVLLPDTGSDFKWEFYNSDGSHANMCGNGARAAALYAYTNELANENMQFLTGAGIIKAKVQNEVVEVALGKPSKLSNPFGEAGLKWHFYDTGVPHLVTFVDDLAIFDKELCAGLRQKYNANVNFASINDGILKVRTFERGVEDETNACGTGMAAAFFAGLMDDKLPKEVKVNPKSLENLFFKFDGENIFFKGAVTHCFDTII